MKKIADKIGGITRLATVDVGGKGSLKKLLASNVGDMARDMINNPQNALEKVRPDLRLLLCRLEEIDRGGTSLNKIVAFFSAVAPLFDRGITDIISEFKKCNYHGKYAEIIKNLEDLNKHITNAGRDEYGMNRAKKGEDVTDENIFLGGVFGRYTYNVNYWKNKFKDEDKSRIVDDQYKKTDTEVIYTQVNDFLKSHAKPMIQALNSIGI